MTKSCLTCKDSTGFLFKCSKPSCKTAYHPHCINEEDEKNLSLDGSFLCTKCTTSLEKKLSSSSSNKSSKFIVKNLEEEEEDGDEQKRTRGRSSREKRKCSLCSSVVTTKWHPLSSSSVCCDSCFILSNEQHRKSKNPLKIIDNAVDDDFVSDKTIYNNNKKKKDNGEGKEEKEGKKEEEEEEEREVKSVVVKNAKKQGKRQKKPNSSTTIPKESKTTEEEEIEDKEDDDFISMNINNNKSTKKKRKREEGMNVERALKFARSSINKVVEEENKEEENETVPIASGYSLSSNATLKALINRREAAKAQREDMIKEKEINEQFGLQKVTEWIPISSGTGSKNVFEPQSLFDLCINMIAKYIDNIEDFGEINVELLQRVTVAICKKKQLTGKMLEVLTPRGINSVSIADCSLLQIEDYTNLWKRLASTSFSPIICLELFSCGRGMNDYVMEELLSTNPLNIVSVILDGCFQLSNKVMIKFIKKCKKIEKLHLIGNNRFGGDLLHEINKSIGHSLKELKICYCENVNNSHDERKVSDDKVDDDENEKTKSKDSSKSKGFCELKDLKALTSLTLNSNSNNTDLKEVLSVMLSLNSNNLRILDLSDCESVLDDTVSFVFQISPSLKQLFLNNNNNITDESITALVYSGIQLTHLSLARCRKITDEGIQFFASKSNYCEYLNLNGCIKITDDSLVSFSKSLSHDKLSHLDISWCRKLTNNGIGMLVDTCISLKRIKLWGCSQFTNDFFTKHSNQKLIIEGRN